jgi:hypothetical protein
VYDAKGTARFASFDSKDPLLTLPDLHPSLTGFSLEFLE